MSVINKSNLSDIERDVLLKKLAERFHKNMPRHPKTKWEEVASKLIKNPLKLESLFQMEESGGEPDIVEYKNESNSYTFFDCSIESPKDRRSLCYDKQALESRKQFKPRHSALEMALEMGADVLNEEQYIFLQTIGDFDLKTSSWIKTPLKVRKLGGGIFGDKRFGRVFFYHNGVESYYTSRGFRTVLKV